MKVSNELPEFGKHFCAIFPANKMLVWLADYDSKTQYTHNTYIHTVHHGGCAVNNGNCQHFCFTVPDRNGGTRPQCGCPTGIMLHADSRTCPERECRSHDHHLPITDNHTRPVGRGDSTGFARAPLLTAKRFYIHRLTVHFKCPTI